MAASGVRSSGRAAWAVVAAGVPEVPVRARRRVVRWLAVAVVVAVFAPVVQTSSVLAAPPDREPGPVKGAPDAASALAAARKSGQPVEVLSRGNERERTLANADGTFRLEQHAEAVRVRRSDGSWVAVDTTLRMNGGQVRPAAVVGDLRFSAGGSGLVAAIARDGKQLSLALPWSLPVPALQGATATYRDVLPGVDLVLTARPEGFSEVLVVRTRQAAASPALDMLRFAVETTGLSVRAAGGGFVAVDTAGETVFSSPAPLMWDSAGGAVRSSGWPVQGDRVARMATTVSGSHVAVVPDRGLLEDAATVFPVYVDPSVTGSRNKWAMISSGFRDQEYYNFAGDEGVGLCDVQVEWTCNVDQVKRLIWEFGIPAAVHRSHVLSATFSAYETHAYDCTADEVQLWWVGGISAATNWNNHAGTWSRHLASANVARKSGCAVGPGSVEFNATGIAADAAAGSWPALAVGLKAGNEGSMSGGWKRFRNDATLSITYNSYPATPSALAVENTACGAFVSSATPELRAHIFDPDGDNDLTVQYAWDRWNTATSAWDRIGDLYKPNQASGTDPKLRLGVDPGTGSALEHGKRYRWAAALLDPYPGGQDWSAWSPWCEFEVDTQNPAVAPGVSSPVYLEYISGVQEDYYGGVGQTAQFTFTANGVADVAGFNWGWADPPTTYVPAATVGGQATLDITPPPPYPNFPTQAGTLTLRVRSVDRAGREGPMRVHTMRVGMGSDAVAAWDLADPAGATTLLDTSGNLHNATASNVTLGTSGRLLSGPGQAAPSAATFNGTTSHAAGGPVVDSRGSYTVSVWVKLASASSYAIAVAQEGNRVGGFGLQYSLDVNRFTMTAVASDADNAAVIRGPAAPTPPRLNVWTHLVGVYDAGAGKLLLYVDGIKAGEVAYNATWNATAALTIGRGKWNGSPTGFWPGQLAEVRVWQRVLSAAEIAPLAATQVGAWSMDGYSSDDTGWGRDLTTTAVSWTSDRAGEPGAAGQFNGNTSQAVTAGPAVRTDQSFTVSARVRLADKSKSMAMIGQDGMRASGFVVGYEPGFDRLAFVMYSGDVDNPVYTFTTSAGAPQAGKWMFLTAVHDATLGQMRFYVDAALVGTVNYSTAWHASGGFVLGRFKYNATPANFFPGDIDDVRAFAGALPASEILKLYQP